jgi:hypothetical protein
MALKGNRRAEQDHRDFGRFRRDPDRSRVFGGDYFAAGGNSPAWGKSRGAAEKSAVYVRVRPDFAGSRRGMKVAEIPYVATRAVITWFGLLVLAFANAALREGWLMPRLGEKPSHAISSVTLAVAILLAGWYATRWVGPESRQQAWAVGAIWLCLTLAFEFLAGHFLFGRSWPVLMADYNLLAGRLWVLVLVTTLTTPLLAFIWHTAPSTRHF